MKKIFNMKTLSLSLGLLLASASLMAQSTEWVAPKEAADVINPVAGNADATKAGKKKYTQLCAICHGDRGKGDGVAGAALKPSPANFTSAKIQAETDGAIFWKITVGRAPMAAYKDILSEEERWQLVNYIRTFKK